LRDPGSLSRDRPLGRTRRVPGWRNWPIASSRRLGRYHPSTDVFSRAGRGQPGSGAGPQHRAAARQAHDLRGVADWRPGGAVGRVAEHDSVGGAASFLKWRSPPGLHIEFRRAPACISIPAMGLHTPDGLSN